MSRHCIGADIEASHFPLAVGFARRWESDYLLPTGDKGEFPDMKQWAHGPRATEKMLLTAGALDPKKEVLRTLFGDRIHINLDLISPVPF